MAPGVSTFDGLAERLQRARATYELRPSQAAWIALLEAENAWLKRQLAEGEPTLPARRSVALGIMPDMPVDHEGFTGTRRRK